ncbi:MAG TPA: serine/threonine protein kinase [Ruminococcus sp.]|nr:serine/threonine protein kinase [Ruminococcus sp.]
MKNNWIDSVLSEQYQLVKVLKNTEKTQICVLQHKELRKRLVKRSIEGTGDVYFVLRNRFHPNISNVYEVFKRESGVTVLEEYIDGQTVSEYLSDDLYTPSGVKSVVSSLCDALEFLHSYKIIHKDIKPENVMVDNMGNVKLIDFDAARIYKPYQNKDTKIIGTTGYAAPEQYGINQTDERTDIYALGVLMNVMLTGSPPEIKLYNGKLKKVILKCTQTVPNNRYQSVKELKKFIKLC